MRVLYEGVTLAGQHRYEFELDGEEAARYEHDWRTRTVTGKLQGLYRGRVLAVDGRPVIEDASPHTSVLLRYTDVQDDPVVSAFY